MKFLCTANIPVYLADDHGSPARRLPDGRQHSQPKPAGRPVAHEARGPQRSDQCVRRRPTQVRRGHQRRLLAGAELRDPIHPRVRGLSRDREHAEPRCGGRLHGRPEGRRGRAPARSDHRTQTRSNPASPASRRCCATSDEPRLRRRARDAARPGAAAVGAARHTVHFKREDLQPVFSFKLRGAYNRIAHSRRGRARRGVITASAGNHAQGVAFSARTRPARRHRHAADDAGRSRSTRCSARRGGGARAATATPTRRRIATAGRRTGLVVHPSLRRSAGHRRTGHRRRRDRAPAPGASDAVFVPVGGGGLIAGIGGYIKAVMPHVRVIGVEPFDSDAMDQSLQAGTRVTLDQVGIFADGVAVRTVGAHTFADRARRRSTKSSACRTTRSARRSRTSSTTRAR